MFLRDYQLEAISKLRTGSILCGGVGSGKSLTALAYYIFEECKGSVKITETTAYSPMRSPRDLYIITTAKKRDSLEWEEECVKLGLSKHEDVTSFPVSITIDSWNNIRKYKDVFGGFFIFDEQRVVGSGSWVKTFLNITRKNHWILLSATPGDQWRDYIPVFVANGFYRNRTDFNNQHCVFSRFSKYPKIERYVGEKLLKKHRDDILVQMKDNRETKRVNIPIEVTYDRDLYRWVMINRWNPYEDEPIAETGKLVYLLRKVVNSDLDRVWKTIDIIRDKKRVIIFYNYSYELETLRVYLSNANIIFTEWNGEKHEDVPVGETWTYLVQYAAGCEGWNCITCNTIIFYSQSYSYRMTEQAAGRIDRINTSYKELYYYYLRSRAPIDRAIYQNLKMKKNFNEKNFVKHLK